MALPLREKRNRAHQFINKYADVRKENAESQSFLNDFFVSVTPTTPSNPVYFY